MRLFSLSTLAVAALASLATPSFAGEVYGTLPLALPTSREADVTNPGMVYAQPNGAGPYDCQVDEKRTRLQRLNCGPYKDVSGE